MGFSFKLPQDIKKQTVVEELTDVQGQFLSDLMSVVVESNKRDYPAGKSYTPSNFHCCRYLYYKRIGVPKRVPPTTYSNERIAQTGTSSHEAIQNYIKSGLMNAKGWTYVNVDDYLKEQHITDVVVTKRVGNEWHCYNSTLDMKFSCDGILYYKGHYILLEIKTETDDKGWMRKEAEPTHIEQATCYCLNLHLDGVLFLYEERSYCNPKAFYVKISQADKQKIVDKIKYVNNCVEKKVVPEKTTHEKLCAYCDYIKTCQMEDLI